MSHYFGWLLFLITYLFIFFIYKAQKDKKVLIAFIIVVSFHHVIAIMNAYMLTTYGASGDASTFHRIASTIANSGPWNFGFSSQFYRIFLAFFYKMFGVSLLLGNELSVFAFLVSCFIFIKIYKILGYTKHISLLLLLYGCLPSMILMGSVTLRESWQILFFMLTIYFSLDNILHAQLSSWVGLVISASIFSLFHEGFVVFSFLLFATIILFHLQKLATNIKHSKGHFFSIIITVFVAVLAWSILEKMINKTPELEVFHALSQGKALDFINDYRSHGMEFKGRTTFGILIDMSSVKGVITSIFLAYFYYMFAPFPWHIASSLDLYASFESFLRLFLLIMGMIAWHKTIGNERKQISFLLLTYLSMSLLWSLGTINYGTSIRHHTVNYWILILLFGSYLHQRYQELPQLKLETNRHAKKVF